MMKKRIMIVEDRVLLRKMISDIFRDNEYDVVGETGDGNEAVAMYMQLKPDLVTMDIGMPNKTGIEILRGIMATDPSAKIIMVSSLANTETIKETLQAGAKNYIVKPFSANTLLKAVEKALSEKA